MSDRSVERRAAPRVSARVPLRLSSDADAQPATLRNISVTGLCCDFPQPLNEMTLLGIQLELPGVGAAHGAQGVVVRCAKRRGINPPTYEIAIYFTAMEPTTREAIQGFVGKHVGAPAPD